MTKPRMCLTDQQRLLLRAAAHGYISQELHIALGCSLVNVRQLYVRLYYRLGVRNKAQAVAYAVAYNLIQYESGRAYPFLVVNEEARCLFLEQCER